MNLIYMGTPEFAAVALKALIGSKHTVSAVVTREDKPKGRNGKPQMSACKELAIEYKIPVFQPKTLKSAEAVREIQKYNPDIIVVAAYGRILPKEILTIPKYGCVNIHASLLPKYRGAAPIQWAILNGEKITGITIMQMDEGLDTGDILMQKEVNIENKETADSLFDKLSETGAGLITEAIDKIEKGEITPVPQPEESPTPYSRMIVKEDGLIDFTDDAETIERRVRGFNPWPGAFCFMDGSSVKIWDADIVTENSIYSPGTVSKADKTALLVQTGKGQLKINSLQLQGKKRMDFDAFLRGCRWERGKRFDGDTN